MKRSILALAVTAILGLVATPAMAAPPHHHLYHHHPVARRPVVRVYAPPVPYYRHCRPVAPYVVAPPLYYGTGVNLYYARPGLSLSFGF